MEWHPVIYYHKAKLRDGVKEKPCLAILHKMLLQ